MKVAPILRRWWCRHRASIALARAGLSEMRSALERGRAIQNQEESRRYHADMERHADEARRLVQAAMREESRS